jgi:hypothetical protein
MYPLYEGLEKTIHDAELLNKINDAVLIRKNYDFVRSCLFYRRELEKTLNKKVIPLLLGIFYE